MNVAAHVLHRTLGPLRRWPVEAQLVARRNAMIASTALAERRAEREEVEEFLAVRRQSPLPEVAAQAAHG